MGTAHAAARQEDLGTPGERDLFQPPSSSQCVRVGRGIGFLYLTLQRLLTFSDFDDIVMTENRCGSMLNPALSETQVSYII